MSPNLLPCPFCAGPARITVVPPYAVRIDQRETARIEFEKLGCGLDGAVRKPQAGLVEVSK